jgi:hypothetical protein
LGRPGKWFAHFGHHQKYLTWEYLTAEQIHRDASLTEEYAACDDCLHSAIACFSFAFHMCIYHSRVLLSFDPGGTEEVWWQLLTRVRQRCQHQA